MRAKSSQVTTLGFYAPAGSAEIVIERAVAIRIVGGALSAGGPVIAWHADGTWHVGDRRLERITLKGPVRVEFQGKQGVQSFGPLAEFSLIGDAAIGPDGVFARYDALEETWYFDRHESRSEALVAKAVARSDSTQKAS